jgi:hypothetical protein
MIIDNDTFIGKVHAALLVEENNDGLTFFDRYTCFKRRESKPQRYLPERRYSADI